MGADPTKTSFYSGNTIDQVVYANTQTINITNSVNATVSIPFTTAITSLIRPIGIFSYDGGLTWNDLGAVQGAAPSTSFSSVINTTTQCFISSGVAVLSATFQVTATVGGGGTIPIIVRIIGLADNPPPILGALPTLGSNPVAYSSTDSQKDAAGYRQIVQEGSFLTFGSTTIVTVPHNFGYVPDVNMWNFTGSRYNLSSTGWALSITGAEVASYLGMAMDATNFYFVEIGTSGFFYKYRSYHP
jgi:hypothetical protein